MSASSATPKPPSTSAPESPSHPHPHPALKVVISPDAQSQQSQDPGPSTNGPPSTSRVSFPCIPASGSLSPPTQRSRSTSRLRALTPTLTLENSGSVARDHLASERTWLAYVRTSLAIASTGVALVQLFTISAEETAGKKQADLGQMIQRFARPLGATTVLLALAVLGIGVRRYFQVQKAMTEGLFPVARKTIVFITAILAALVAVVFGILIAIPRQS